ncbi:ribosomal protein S6 kinase delta-1-like isoform X2 [Scylla paramamosain]|uniref:ribosomal protein S6 kinase delta-1-like isoform X2 n=1 Tax=Scylla paramamosain TaxID=85552 RepID=UPI003082D964
MAAKTQHWVRIFEVNETKRHPKGYTIYQVKSTVFPRTSPEASTSVVVWRRYSEISRLHRAISELHEKLGLSGKLPPFPRATILNRFEADVVEARREATLNLLKFIGQHSPLFTSEPFTSFFQNNEKKTTGHFGERRKRTKGRSKEAEQLATTLGIQDSVSLYSQLSESEDDLSLCSTPDYPFPVIPAPSTSDLAEASGSVGFDFSGDPHRSNTTQSVSRMKNGSVGTLGVSEESQRKILSKNLQENHHALQRTTEGQTVKEKVIHDQNALLSHNSSMDDSVFEFPQGDLNSHVVDPSDLSEKHTITSSVSSTSSLSYCVYENPVHDSPLHQESYHKDLKQPEDIMPTTTHPLPPVNITKSVSIPERKSSVPLTPLTPLTTTVTPYVPTHKVPTPQEVANSQYIFIAAQQISEAQQHEQQKDYKKALNMYREGVGTLLQGVQGDNDGDRRDAVKRKTAQYLQRAEQLVARLTRRDKKREQFLDGPEAEVCSGGEGDLKCSATDLARYKVVGWTGSVIIATDSSNGDTVAIKVHVKSGIGSGEKTVIPREVPFMVPVMRYHETDTAIYLVLKYISGGKLWSHIKKYVEAEENFYNTLHGSVTTTTYSGRRLLQESMEYDRSSAGHQTPSHNSHVSHLSSASLLNIPTCTTTRANSECSDVSSTCLPDAYLQIYSEYDPTLPSSSSMLILPHNTHNNHTTMDSVPKSLSTGALSGTSVYPDPGCAGPHDSGGKSVAENKVTKDYVPWPNGDNMIEEDKVSIGSDTLSGVSEDFSCSLPVGVPDLLPDTVPLPEVRITADSSVISSCNELPQTVGGKESRKDNINGYLKGESQRSSKTNNIVTKEVTPEDGKELLDTRQLKSPLTENGGKETVSPTTAVSPTAADHLEPDDENSITDTSFASITLPSFSWAKQEESEVASLDIEDLIRNSRQLLQNVDHTLLQSRSQSVIFPISGESSSGDQSELPNDNGSINQDQPNKKGALDSQTLHEKKSLGIKLSKSNSSVRVSPLMARRLGLNQEGHRTKKSSLKCTRSENNLSTPQKFATSVTENNKIDLETGVVKQIIDMSLNGTSQAVSQHSEQSQDYVEKWSSESKESLSLAKCDPPSENSLAALLEKYSASRGQDSQPRLPEGIVKVWLSQIISAVSSLHHQGIVLGDLNPDDILLDEGGSILMTHVSRWSSVQQGVWKARGVSSMSKVWIQRGYLAPELISPVAHPTPASDWWSIGALMYHLLTGQSLSRAHPSGITSHTELLMPPHLTPEAVSLLSQLLCVHPTERLGGGGAGVQEVKDHPFFTGIQWAN